MTIPRWWTRDADTHATLRPGYIRIHNAQRGIIQEIDGFGSVYQAVASLELNGFKPVAFMGGRGGLHDLDAPKPITWKSLWFPDACEQSMKVH
jgi:hypothetical protein